MRTSIDSSFWLNVPFNLENINFLFANFFEKIADESKKYLFDTIDKWIQNNFPLIFCTFRYKIQLMIWNKKNWVKIHNLLVVLSDRKREILLATIQFVVSTELVYVMDGWRRCLYTSCQSNSEIFTHTHVHAMRWLEEKQMNALAFQFDSRHIQWISHRETTTIDVFVWKMF